MEEGTIQEYYHGRPYRLGPVWASVLALEGLMACTGIFPILIVVTPDRVPSMLESHQICPVSMNVSGCAASPKVRAAWLRTHALLLSRFESRFLACALSLDP